MIPSDELFLLIKSLSPSEKRYFKIWSSKHVIGQSNSYEKLFDAIEALPSDEPYDEAAFKKAMRGKSFIKNLSDEKNNLKENLLSAMRAYHADGEVEGRVLSMLQEIRFLRAKGLMPQCRRLLDKTFALCEEHELLEVKQILFKLLRFTDLSPNDEKKHKAFAELRKKEIENIEMIGIERETEHIRNEISYLNANSLLEKEKESVDKMVARLEEMERMKHVSFNALQLAITAKTRVHTFRREFERSFALYSQLVDAYENTPWQIREYPEKYAIVIENALGQLFQIKRFEDMPPLLDKLSKIQSNDKRVKSLIFVTYWQMMMIYLLNTNRNVEAKRVLPELQKGIKDFGSALSLYNRVYLLNNIYITYLRNGDYIEVLHTINEIYAVWAKKTEFKQIIFDLKFVEFIAQYETGGRDILDSVIRSGQRWLRENEMNSAYTDMVWKGLKQLSSCLPDQQKVTRAEIKKQMATATCPNECDVIKQVITEWL